MCKLRTSSPAFCPCWFSHPMVFQENKPRHSEIMLLTMNRLWLLPAVCSLREQQHRSRQHPVKLSKLLAQLSGAWSDFSKKLHETWKTQLFKSDAGARPGGTSPAGSTRRLEASIGYIKDPVFKETRHSHSILDFTAIHMLSVLRMCFWRFWTC